MENKQRCSWVNLDNLLSIAYHDTEWGIPQFDDNKLFEMLILEGAQAGLSWNTILNKRENYRLAFDHFDPTKIAKYDEQKIQELLKNKGIIRNKLKVRAAVKNAQVFLAIQQEFRCFADYLWAFVDGKPIENSLQDYRQAPTHSDISDKLSKDLKKRGMSFVGTTIIYAFMQAVGMVNDHQLNCFCKKEKNNE